MKTKLRKLKIAIFMARPVNLLDIGQLNYIFAKVLISGNVYNMHAQVPMSSTIPWRLVNLPDVR